MALYTNKSMLGAHHYRYGSSEKAGLCGDWFPFVEVVENEGCSKVAHRWGLGQHLKITTDNQICERSLTSFLPVNGPNGATHFEFTRLW